MSGIVLFKQVEPGKAGVEVSKGKDRMCAGRSTSAMATPRFFVVMCRGGDVTCFDVMSLSRDAMRCQCDALSCDELSSVVKCGDAMEWDFMSL